MTTQKHPSTPVNGLEMYYEIHGSGRPLVLLHGNLSTIGTSFGKVLPKLSSTRRIIAIEQQGHGHTADIDRPLSIEQWAQDTTTLLHHLGIEQADFFGYSSGGAVALEVALRSPALVRKLVFAGGTSYRRDGFYPELLAAGETMKPKTWMAPRSRRSTPTSHHTRSIGTGSSRR